MVSNFVFGHVAAGKSRLSRGPCIVLLFVVVVDNKYEKQFTWNEFNVEPNIQCIAIHERYII